MGKQLVNFITCGCESSAPCEFDSIVSLKFCKLKKFENALDILKGKTDLITPKA
jgi:hypothetical protein